MVTHWPRPAGPSPLFLDLNEQASTPPCPSARLLFGHWPWFSCVYSNHFTLWGMGRNSDTCVNAYPLDREALAASVSSPALILF